VSYDLNEVDFSKGVMPDEHHDLHPFGKVPVLSHGEYVIYETAAICRYIDTAFEGMSLQPSIAQDLRRKAQIIGIIDAYLSEEIRMGYVSELLINPKIGASPNRDRIEESRIRIEQAFFHLDELISAGPFFIGDRITLADCHAIPLIDYLSMTPGGDELISEQPGLRAWWSSIRERPAVVRTSPDLSVFNGSSRTTFGKSLDD